MKTPIRRASLASLSVAALVAMSAILAACASAPPVRFHSLLPVDSVLSPAAPAAGFSVSLAPVAVPPQVDQPQWLVRSADGTLSLLEQERWAAPLRSELRSALLDRWVTRWAALEVPPPQPPSAVSTSALSAWRVVVDVTRFESFPGREVRLESRWWAQSAQSGQPAFALNCRSVIHENIGDGMLALAAGHRRAAARLADEVAQQLLALQRGEAAQCAPAG